RLEANGKMDVYYEITIPENIEPGSYWNVVMVEPVDDIKPDESKGVKVNTVVRYAVLLVTTTMDAVAEAKIIFKSVNLTKQDQKNQLRSEEHTSELQSRENLVCRLLLEKK